jgi:outer membrane protein OmpA-like peptidoglycan-associated protein
MPTVKPEPGRILATIVVAVLALHPPADAQGRAGHLRLAVGDHETGVRAIGHVGALRAGGSPTLTLVLDDFPLDQFTRTGGADRRGGSTGETVASAVTRPDAIGRGEEVAGDAVAGFRPFRAIEELSVWVSRDEQTRHDVLTCPRPAVFGAVGAGRTVVLNLVCTRAVVRDVTGGGLYPNWTGEAISLPPAPVHLEFAPGSGALSGGEIASLERLLDALRRWQRAEVAVEGHAGADEDNPDALAGQRAAAVRDYLIAGGIAPDRVHALSHGREKPIEPDLTESPWSHNRRAHTTILLGGVGP